MISIKSSGIIRRMDDLGRIVVTKELRQHLQAGEGTPCELIPCRDEDNRPIVVIRPYWTLSSMLNRNTCHIVASSLKEVVGEEMAFVIMDEPGNIVAKAGNSRVHLGGQQGATYELDKRFIAIHKEARRKESIVTEEMDSSSDMLRAYPLEVPVENSTDKVFIGTLIAIGALSKELDAICAMAVSMLTRSVGKASAK